MFLLGLHPTMCDGFFDSFLAQSNVTDSVLEVVAYEARRLFRDRLVSSKDLHTFDNILSSIVRGDWGSDALDNMTGTRTLEYINPSPLEADKQPTWHHESS